MAAKNSKSKASKKAQSYWDFYHFVQKHDTCYVLNTKFSDADAVKNARNIFKDKCYGWIGCSVCCYYPSKHKVAVVYLGKRSLICCESALKTYSNAVRKSVDDIISSDLFCKYTFSDLKKKVQKKRDAKIRKKTQKVDKHKTAVFNAANGETFYSCGWVVQTQKALLKKSTHYEATVYKNLPQELKQNSVRQCVFSKDSKLFYFDIYIKDYNVAIEVDGGYHQEQLDKDAERDAMVARSGIKTFRITNEDTKVKSKLHSFIDAVGDYCLGRT